MALKVIDDTKFSDTPADTGSLESIGADLDKAFAGLEAFAEGGEMTSEQIEAQLESLLGTAPSGDDVSIEEADAALDEAMKELDQISTEDAGAAVAKDTRGKDDTQPGDGDKDATQKKKSDDDKDKGDDKDKDSKSKKTDGDVDTDTTTDDDDDDDDSAADDSDDDDGATEAALDAEFGAESLCIMLETAQETGGLQPSMMTMTSKLLRQDELDSVSLAAIESMGTAASAEDVNAALESLFETVKGKITSAMDAIGSKIGNLGVRIEEMIKKVPGGESINDAALKAQKKISAISQSKAFWIIAAATAVLTGFAAWGAAAAGLRSIEGIVAFETRAFGGVRESTKAALKLADGSAKAAGEVGTHVGKQGAIGAASRELTTTSESLSAFFKSLKGPMANYKGPAEASKAIALAAKPEAATSAAELGWTAAAWNTAKSNILKLLNGFKRVWFTIVRAVKAVPNLLRNPNGAFDSTKAASEYATSMRKATAAFIRIGSFLYHICAFIVGTIIVSGIARVLETCRHLADIKVSSDAKPA